MSSYVSDFFQFLWAIITTWANLWTGGVIVATVGIYHLLRRIAISGRTYKAMALLFLVIACFNTWRKEYKKSNPGLHLSLDEYGFAGGAEDIGPQGTRPIFTPAAGTPAIVVATVRNLGAPSIADNWTLSIAVPGRRDIIKPRIVGFDLKNQPILTIGDDTIPLSKLLYKQTLAPIATGDKKQGVLIFFVDGMSKNEFKQGTKLTLTCEDVANNTISSQTVEFDGKNEGHKHFVGLE